MLRRRLGFFGLRCAQCLPNCGDELFRASLFKEVNGLSYTSVASILKNNLERQKPEQSKDGPVIHHANLRGGSYFH